MIETFKPEVKIHVVEENIFTKNENSSFLISVVNKIIRCVVSTFVRSKEVNLNIFLNKNHSLFSLVFIAWLQNVYLEQYIGA